MAKPQVLPDDRFNCPHCRARYSVTYTRTATRDSGSAYCKVCRRRMVEWNAYKQPSYTPLDQSRSYDERVS
jgi:transcription elongation factor Elf1